MLSRSRALSAFWKTKVDPKAPIRFARIPQKRPYIVPVEAGKTYYWCSCGLSENQPWCDAKHVAYNTKHNTQLKPVAFKAETTKRVMLCGCKQSDGPPFCDMSHIGVAFRTAVGIDRDPKAE